MHSKGRHRLNAAPRWRDAAAFAASLLWALTASAQTPAGPASSPAAAIAQVLAADTPATTTRGNPFTAPQGWTLSVRGNATRLDAPERGSVLLLVDVQAADADAALAAAWPAYRPDAPWPLRQATPLAARDGWRERQSLAFQTGPDTGAPNPPREVTALVQRNEAGWTVVIQDLSRAVADKRAAQVAQVLGTLLPQGHARETFAGRRANPLTPERVAELRRFVQRAMAQTQVPGVALGLIAHGQVVFAGGFGVRALGQSGAVSADTRFQIASNTKALTTLMLAKLVDQGRLGWDTPVTTLLPGFRLGQADTTRQVRVKHLVCACTGLPRQDMEWLLEYGAMTPERTMQLLATMQPTSGFGELFQYSNPMAAAAGFVGGHVAQPTLPLGAAYDRAMQALVFDPLGMRRSTFDFARAQRGDTALPHAPDVNGRMVRTDPLLNRAMVPVRPAGGAWSTVNDLLRYLAMELAEGRLPNGQAYLSPGALLARRVPQVSVGTGLGYGMGLAVDDVHGTPLLHHGGDMIGYHSDMLWLPEHGVGAVLLTNGDLGALIRTQFARKLLEVLFDGQPEADAVLEAAAKGQYGDLAVARKLLTVPADPAIARQLAAHYRHPAIGSVRVSRRGARLRFDFGEWQSEMATRRLPDGGVTLSTLAPGVSGLVFEMGRTGQGREARRTLTLRDAQHTYEMTEVR